MVTIQIYDCGCVESRPKNQHCKSYGTRWRNYLGLNYEGQATKIIMKCRDCGRVRHFILLNTKQPSIIQYGTKDEEE